MENIPIFQCCACGTCCKNIKGFAGKEEKEFLEEYGQGKLPIVQIIPPKDMTFPLWDFEAKRFHEYEKEVNINAHIIPSRGIMDLQSNRFIVAAYQMTPEKSACPFLDHFGKCTIYHTKRAYVCHLFPLNRSPYLKTEDESYAGLFGTCHTLSKFQDSFNLNNTGTLKKQLYRSFGEGFLNAIQHDIVMEWINRATMDMMKKKMIKPAMNYPYEFLMKRISNSKHIDFSDFLIQCGYLSQKEVSQKIERFEALEDAKDKLREDGMLESSDS